MLRYLMMVMNAVDDDNLNDSSDYDKSVIHTKPSNLSGKK